MTQTSGQIATPDNPRRRRRRGPIARVALWRRQVFAELRKVVYPTRQQLLTYTAVVLVFVAIMITIVSLLDLGLGWVTLKVFG